MSVSKTLHQVGAIVGLPPNAVDDILVEVKANQARLEGCAGPHDFSVCLDRRSKQPVAEPTPQQRFGAYWRCVKCNGSVDGQAKRWYELGLKHAAARPS